jgi:hypothetical protein
MLDQLLGGLIPVATTVSLTFSGILLATYSLIFFLAFVHRQSAESKRNI